VGAGSGVCGIVRILCLILNGCRALKICRRSNLFVIIVRLLGHIVTAGSTVLPMVSLVALIIGDSLVSAKLGALVIMTAACHVPMACRIGGPFGSIAMLMQSNG